MRVLVVGGGGREHAIVEALRRSRADIYAAMANQNPGIRRASKDVLLGDVTAVDAIARWASDRQVELAIIGPEGPLEKGITDALEAAHIPTVGPSREAAQLETNKEFTRELMRDHGIPGAPRFWAFGDLPEFEKFVNASDFEFVIKPIGLTAGKGVRVWGDHFRTKVEALAYGKEILTKQIGGVPRFLVEEKLVGEEFSLQALCDGHALVPAPLAQDHKRAYEGDKGPNTGGMGSYSDADHRLPFVTPQDFEGALETMRKTVAAMAARGTPFKGILYGGFMATKDGPKLLEFNVRFADPESMNVVPMGYGSHPKAGEQLKVDEDSIRQTGAKLYYASVDEKGGHLYTTTSRSLAIVGIAANLQEAESISEEALAFIAGSFYARRDIGKPDVIQRKVERMQKIRQG